MNSLVSVVIPARNEARDLPRALAALAAQDYPTSHMEVVVVDGDSTDETTSVALDLLARGGYHRFEVVANPGGNTPSNLNRGLAWALGDVVVRVDARSEIPPAYITRTVEVLDSRPDVSVTGGSQVAVSRSSSTLDESIAAALNNPLAMGGSRYRRGAQSGFADTVYLGVFRREQLLEAGGWNEHFSTNQDFELNRRMARFGKVWFEADLCVGYLPRSSIADLCQQYHRFGRWKAHYWKRTGDRPQPRQVVLLAAPPVAGGVVAAAARVLSPCLGRPLKLAAAGFAVVAGAMAGPKKLSALCINGLVGCAWWAGVVRGLVRDDVAD